MKDIKNLMPPTATERHLKSEVDRLEKSARERKRDAGRILDAMNDVLEAVRSETPPKLIVPPKTVTPVTTPITQVIHLTDWHIGEVVPKEHVEEFGEANYRVACERIEKLGNSVTAKAQLMRGSYKVETCHVIGTADWISGDIHEELVRTNEFPSPVQAVKSGFLLGNFIVSMSAHYPQVNVDLLTAGNHDRITKKSQSADGGLNSFGYITCEIARKVASACRNVKINVHVSLSTVIEVCGQRYLIAHGDGIKGTWGIPFYGIERKKQKEAMARMNMDPSRHFDKIVIGHFHTALNHEHWLIGGSLTGTNEFDHKEGRHSRPHQTSWFLHRTHGEFDWTRWWL